MDKSRLETKVGLFVLIGLVLLAVLLVQFSKGTSIFRGTYELRLHALNVGGLKQRAGVLLSGVQVGGVSDIQLAQDGKSVTIILKIYKTCKIYSDARFAIEQSGFLGDQYVAVIPTSNTPPVLQDGAVVDCQEPFNLLEIAHSASGFIKQIDGTAKKLDDSITILRQEVLNQQTLTNFTAVVDNMRVFSEQALSAVSDIDALVLTNGAQVNLAVSNVVYFSQDMIRLADSAQGLIATNSPGIAAAISNIESSTETLKKLAEDLQSGKGLAGTLMQNEQVATNVQAIAYNLSVASSNLNRLGLWKFLWHHEPVPTNAPAPTRDK